MSIINLANYLETLYTKANIYLGFSDINDYSHVEELILFHLRYYPNDIKFVNNVFKRDESFALKVVAINGRFLNHLGDKIRYNKQVVLEAVKRNGAALGFASDDLRDDREVVLEAVKRYANALGFASDRLRDDDYIVSAAIKHCGYSIIFASDRLFEKLAYQTLKETKKYSINEFVQRLDGGIILLYRNNVYKNIDNL